MSTLYELSQDAKELEGLLDNLEGLGDEQAVEETKNIQNIVKKLIEDKSEGLIAVVRHDDMMIENIDSEIARLKDLKAKKLAKIKRIKAYAFECMQTMGVKKIETSLGNMSIRKGTGSVNILDESKLTDDYKKVKTEISVDKKAIKDAIKAGIEVEGAELVYNDSLNLPKTPKEK